MIRIRSLAVCLCAGAAYAQTTYTANYQSYDPNTGGFTLTQSIAYQLPDPARFGPGPYPVFIHVPGTFEVYNSNLAMLFVSQMASRGLLSASVQYMNTESQQSCLQYTPRAQGIFDATRSASAVGVLCALPAASCSKGITAQGISQGAELSLLAANYAPQVKAVFAMSAGDEFVNFGGFPLKCVDKVNTKIPANRLTVINGVADPFFGGQTPIQNVSGFACATGATQCWSPDGSGAGWYIVQNWQNAAGLANHCYMFDNKGSSDYSCSGPFDVNWNLPSTFDWSLGPNLDWLATMGTRRNFSATGY
jgi:dienelactone hydrolase